MVLADTSAVLSLIRKTKSEAKVSMRAEILSAVLTGPSESVQRAMLASQDLRAAGRIAELTAVAGGDHLEVKVTFADTGQPEV